MLLSICNFLQPGQYAEGEPSLGQSAFDSYEFGPNVGNSWRTDTDVGTPGNVTFTDVLRNMDADAAHPQAAGPGHWNDPDYLGPDQGMSSAQFRSQFSMWAMLAAPLMISDDLTKMCSREPRGGAEPRSDRDRPGPGRRPGHAGVLLRQRPGVGQAAARRLARGRAAQPRLDRRRGSRRASPRSACRPPRRYALRNLWTRADALTGGSISAEVPGDGTVLLRVSAS